MRASAWILASVLMGAALAGCSPHAPAAPAAPAPPAAPTPAEAPPIAAAPAPPEAPAAPAPPAAPAEVHFSPADYAVHERRVNALINNAESRDTSGETQYVAEQGRAQRARCRTKACIEQSYAAEEARLRKWEGSGDIR